MKISGTTRRIAATILAVLAIALAGSAGVSASTEHCPSGGVKVEATGDNLNLIVPPVGALVCVKGSTDATGIVVADGVQTLVEILGNGHDVSYYVTYEEVQTSPTPSSDPTPSPDPSATPQPSEPTPTSTPTPTASPTATATATPTVTITPTQPAPTLPPTDTVPDTATSTTGNPVLLLLAAIFAIVLSVTLLAPERKR